jgi:hypothetical protein
MRRSATVVALGCIVLALIAACSSSDEQPTATTAADESTTTSTAGTTVDQAGPPPDEVLSDWVASDPDVSGGGPYLGPCPTEFDADLPQEGLCSVVQFEGDDRVVYGLGPPFSEILIYVLMVDSDGEWTVEDSYAPVDPYALEDAPDWLAD